MKSILTAILVLVLCSVASAEDIWKVTSLNWQPYSGAQMDNQGNSIQKLRNLLAKKSIELQVEFYPWSRAQALAHKEEYIGYFPAWPEEVKEGFVASPTIDESQIGVVRVKDKDLQYKSIADLFKRYKVGVVRSYNYPPFVNDVMKRFPENVEFAPSEIALIKMLKAKRFECAITDPNVSIYLANQLGYSNILIDRVLDNIPLVMAIQENEYTQHRINLIRQVLN